MSLAILSGNTGLRSALCLVAILLVGATDVLAVPEGPPSANVGGGATALGGAAAAPDVSLFTGAAVTSIPIEVPPGRNGMQPNPALAYSSQSGDGPYLGVGWGMVLGRIERSRRNGVPRYDMSQDEFVLTLPDGASELVATSASYDRFALKVDTRHADIRYTADDEWTMNDVSGRVYTFGSTPAARVGGPDGTFAWHLTRVQDRNGNYLEIVYEQVSGIAYPTAIWWGANVSAMPLHRYQVQFTWESRATMGASVPFSYAAGFRQDVTRVLKSIRVDYYPGGVIYGGQAVPIRRYDLTWRVSAGTSRPLLDAVQLTGYDSEGNPVPLERGPGTVTAGQQTEAAPWKFQYEEVSQPIFEERLDASGNPIEYPAYMPSFRNQVCGDNGWPCTKTRDFIDLDSDGRPDVVTTGGWTSANPEWEVHLNKGWSAAVFDAAATPWAAPYDKIIETNKIQNGHTGTAVALLDLNRDSRPDLVRSPHAGEDWTVYYNNGRGFDPGVPWPLDGGDGFTGEGWVQEQKTKMETCPWCLETEGWNEICLDDCLIPTLSDTVDLNGDGYPDRIATGNWDATHTWDVWWNQGNGSWKHGTLVSPVRRVRKGTTNVEQDFFDLNGDGLPDIIQAPYQGPPNYVTQWVVWFGDGQGFVGTNGRVQASQIDPDTDLPTGNPGFSWALPPPEDESQCLYGDFSVCPDVGSTRLVGEDENLYPTDYKFDTIDVNGDGLPDFIWNANNQDWYVRINTGNQFSPRRAWAIGHSFRTVIEQNTNLTGLRWDMFDIDGNGFLDLVKIRNVPDTIRVWYGHASQDASGAYVDAPPDRLVWMQNPIGAESSIKYAVASGVNSAPGIDPLLATAEGVDTSLNYMPVPRWVASEIDQENGALTTNYTYRGGYYAAHEREFRGFHQVVVSRPSGGYETTYFHQTKALAGQRYRTLTHAFDSAPLDEETRLKEQQWDWQWDEEAVAGGTRYLPYVHETTRIDFGSSSDWLWASSNQPEQTARTTFLYDACGNVTNEDVYAGPMGATTPIRSTQSSYWPQGCEDASGDGVGGVCIGVCNNVLTESGDASGATTSLTKVYYYTAGGQGNLQDTILYDPALSGSDLPVTHFEYDAAGFGNLERITDPRGIVTEHVYDTATKMHVVQTIADANGAHEVSTMEFDYRFGLPTRLVDASGADQETKYDPFGRVWAEAAPGYSLPPGNDRTGATTQIDYIWPLSDGDGRQRVDRYEKEPNALNGYRLTVTFADRLGRVLQVQEPRLVNGERVTVVTRAMRYLPGGRVECQFPPMNVGALFLTAFASGFTCANAPATRPTYDEFGRVLEQVAPDGAETSTSFRQPWITRTCDAAYHASGGTDGACTEVERDGLGRVVEERVYDAGTTLRTRTEHHYDAAGRLEWDQQNGDLATKVTYEYDAFDRQTAKVDPDSGRWERRYDKAGNLQCVDDPIDDQHVWMVYDGMNRVVRKEHRRGACPPSQSVSDPNEIVACTEFGYYAGDAGVTLAGRPAFERTCDGTCDACVAEGRERSSRTFTQYHPRGMVEEATQSIHPPGQIERHYVTTRTYDAAGRLKTTSVPYDETTDETVTYQYSAEAALVAVYSDKHQYVNDIAYDYLGRVTSMAYANGVTDTRQYWPVDTPQPGRGLRLSEVTTTGPAGTLRHTVHLTYRATGQPQDAWDLVHTGQSDPLNNSWTAQYDDLGRLVSWVRAGGSPVQSTFTYDDLGNLTSKDGKTYSYDLDGPHQASQVGTEFLDYDAAGHMVQLPGNEGAEWDAEGRLTRVCTGRCDTGGTTRTTYGYDANGDRIWADAPQGGFTYYFDDFDVSGGKIKAHVTALGQRVATIELNEGTILTASVGKSGANTTMVADATFSGMLVTLVGVAFIGAPRTRAGRRIGAARVTLALAVFVGVQFPVPARSQSCDPPGPPGAGTVFYVADRLGSTELLTDYTGAVLEQLRARPYGEVNAFTPTGQPESTPLSLFQFTGHRGDDGTGLYYFGARFYEPALGLFLSHDPQGQFLSPYSYAGGDPLSGTDPNGEFLGLLIPIIQWLLQPQVIITLTVAASVIDAAASGASGEQIAFAGATALASGLVLAPGTAGIGAEIGHLGLGAQVAVGAVAAGLATYGAVRAFEGGAYASGSLNAVLAAIAVAGVRSKAASWLAGKGKITRPEDGALADGCANESDVTSQGGTDIRLDHHKLTIGYHAEAQIINPNPEGQDYRVWGGPEKPASGWRQIWNAARSIVGGHQFGKVVAGSAFVDKGIPPGVDAKNSVLVRVPVPFDKAVAGGARYVGLVNAAGVRYDALGPNSNSVAYGLSPFLGGPVATPPVFAPGAGPFPFPE